MKKKDWQCQAGRKSCGQRYDKGGYGYRVDNKSQELVDLLSSKGPTSAVMSSYMSTAERSKQDQAYKPCVSSKIYFLETQRQQD